MTTGICSHCGREASTLHKCLGSCGGDALYCNKTCQRHDRAMHKKICPVAGKGVAQPLTFEISHSDDHVFAKCPPAPVRAVRRMDGVGGSGMTLLFSDHLGMKPLIEYAKVIQICDDEEEALEAAEALAGGSLEYEVAVTEPVDPKIMKLKPEEACFNTVKHPDAVNALLEHGIITDIGKRVQLGFYREKFPICRIHAPQTEKRSKEEIIRRNSEHMAMLKRMGVTVN